MLTVVFFSCFSVCFSAIFTANSKNFAVKTDEKQLPSTPQDSGKTAEKQVSHEFGMMASAQLCLILH
jgi:hypothetical protein